MEPQQAGRLPQHHLQAPVQPDGHIVPLPLQRQKSPFGKDGQAQGRPGERLCLSQLRRQRTQQRQVAGGEAAVGDGAL